MTRHLRRGVALLACLATGAAIVPAASGSRDRPVTRKVTVSDDMYSAGRVTIHAGSSVSWSWSKRNFNTHNVTLIKGPRGVARTAFTSKDGGPGYHFQRRFTRTGAYHFECTIHPFMNILVNVEK